MACVGWIGGLAKGVVWAERYCQGLYMAMLSALGKLYMVCSLLQKFPQQMMGKSIFNSLAVAGSCFDLQIVLTFRLFAKDEEVAEFYKFEIFFCMKKPKGHKNTS